VSLLDSTAQRARCNKSRPNPTELIRFPEEVLKIHFSLNQPCQSLLSLRTLRKEMGLESAGPLPFKAQQLKSQRAELIARTTTALNISSHIVKME
jgi:hypothetical protein